MTYEHYQKPDQISMTVNGQSGMTVTDIVSKRTNIGFAVNEINKNVSYSIESFLWVFRA